MRLGNNLFLKMFVGFWLTTMIIAGSWLVIYQYFDEQPDDTARPPPGERRIPHRFMLRSIYDLQNADRSELPGVLTEASRGGRVELYLLDNSGADFLGREVSPPVADAALQLDAHRRGFIRDKGSRYIAHRIYRRDLGEQRAVFVLKPPPSTVLGLLGASPALRLALAVVISGLVSYILSRLLTSRLAQLRTASRRLARGDLSTRAPVRARGGDETDELARDFNTMAAQLQERILAQKRLLSDVSHELRSPLARLHVALALAQQDPGASERHLQRIETEAERLEALIAQLLESQASGTDHEEHIDLVALLQVLAEDTRFEGSARGVTVALDSDVAEALVATTGDLLRKAFDNILRNALSHSPDHAAIAVHVAQTADHYDVTIRDEGPGVPSEDLERIFGEFYRVDTARARESGGYGLGLAIARRAVTLHGGEITAENSGSGLAVHVRLPAAGAINGG